MNHCTDCPRYYAELSSQCCQFVRWSQAPYFSDDVRSQLDASTLAVALVSEVGPAAITRFVIAATVDAVNRLSGRSRSHVAQKRREIIAPFVAHPDAECAIAWVTDIARIVTTVLCASPRFVFARRLFTFCVACMTVPQPRLCGGSQAATTLRLARAKSCSVNVVNCAAVATAQPIRVAGISHALDSPASYLAPAHIDSVTQLPNFTTPCMFAKGVIGRPLRQAAPIMTGELLL